MSLRAGAGMVSDLDIWLAATLLIRRHGADAELTGGTTSRSHARPWRFRGTIRVEADQAGGRGAPGAADGQAELKSRIGRAAPAGPSAGSCATRGIAYSISASRPGSACSTGWRRRRDASDVDAVAEDVVAVDDDVAEVDCRLWPKRSAIASAT